MAQKAGWSHQAASLPVAEACVRTTQSSVNGGERSRRNGLVERLKACSSTSGVPKASFPQARSVNIYGAGSN